jgi:hypothetical protein
LGTVSVSDTTSNVIEGDREDGNGNSSSVAIGSSSSVPVIDSSVIAVVNSSSIPVIDEDLIPLPLDFDGSDKPLIVFKKGSEETKDNREESGNVIKEPIKKRAKKSHAITVETV